MSPGLLVVCFCVTVMVAGEENNGGVSRIVNTAQGPVRGYKDPERNLFAFYSIPYATVEDRYRSPVAPPIWVQTFEAVDRGIICPQSNTNRAEIIMQEDCLIANVFVPDTEQRNLPVLVNFHGGAFQFGYGDQAKHNTFVEDNQIITVTFNYRLAILGFLCLGTDNAPGNAGLKDQVALLRWVKQNIAYFGGNPDDITISGCSAGGAAVNLLMLSETTKGLFNRVISDSGANIGSFAVQVDPLENAKNNAGLFNFTNVNDINALEEFYLTASLELLTSRTFMNNQNSGVTFGPCVERITSDETFLSDAPYNMLRKGSYSRYPMLYGFTDMEGLMRLPQFSDWQYEMNENFADFLPADLQFESVDQKEVVAKTVKEFYFGNEPVSSATITSFIDYFTDVLFAYSVLRSVKLHHQAGNNTLYLYKYSFVDNNTFIIPGTNESGADHCSQNDAVSDEDETTITEEYRNMKKIMRTLRANFIKTGMPVPEGFWMPPWPPVAHANRSPYMSLGQTVELKGIPLEQRTRFWDVIYEQHYSAPVPPPATDSAPARIHICFIYILVFSLLMSRL